MVQTKKLHYVRLLTEVLVFVFAVILFCLPQYDTYLRDAKIRLGNADHADWSATNVWIESAACARQTGSFLTICREDGLHSLAESDLGDDPGHALFLGLYAAVTHHEVKFFDVVYLNGLINLVGLSILAGLLFAMRIPIAGAIFLYFGSELVFNWTALQPHPAQYGMAAMATILPLTLIAQAGGVLTFRRAVGFMVIGVGCLALAALFRQAIGMMGLVASLGALAVSLVLRGRISFRNFIQATVMAIVIVAANNSSLAILKLRDNLFQIKTTEMVQVHGISHSLYLGLGVVDNKFGIVWDDSFGFMKAHEINPAIQAASKDYYRIIAQEYFRLVLSDPVEVARIYAVKFFVALEQTAPKNCRAFFLGKIGVLGNLLLIIGGWIAMRRYGWDNKYNFPHIRILYGISTIFITLLLAQAVIINPGAGYLAPMFLYFFMINAALLDIAIRAWVKGVRGSERNGWTNPGVSTKIETA